MIVTFLPGVLVASAGAAAFASLGGTALTKDVALQKFENKGKRVYPRAYSQATADPGRSPHWYFVAAAVAYAPTISAMAVWRQAADPSTHVSTPTFAIASGVSFFLMTVSPNFDSTVTERVLHTLRGYHSRRRPLVGDSNFIRGDRR